MPTLILVVLALAIGALVLVPTRRLFLAGWSSGALTVYFALMLGLGVLVAELRGPARFLIPIFVLGYIAPFVTARDGVTRLRDRFNGTRSEDPPRPPKNVTPRDDRPTGA